MHVSSLALVALLLALSAAPGGAGESEGEREKLSAQEIAYAENSSSHKIRRSFNFGFVQILDIFCNFSYPEPALQSVKNKKVIGWRLASQKSRAREKRRETVKS